MGCHWFFKMVANLEFFKSLYHFSLTPYTAFNWLSWLLLHWAMLLVPSEHSKPLPKSHSIISQKAWFEWFFLFFFHLSPSSQAIPVLSEPLELVSSQFSIVWVEMGNKRNNKRKEDIFCWWIHGCESMWLCVLMPFKLVCTWCAWIQLSIKTASCYCFCLILCIRKEHVVNVILLPTLLSRL